MTIYVRCKRTGIANVVTRFHSTHHDLEYTLVAAIVGYPYEVPLRRWRETLFPGLP